MRTTMKLVRAHPKLLPLLALVGLCVYTVVVTLTTQVQYEEVYFDRKFNIRHYLAFLAVALNLGIYFYYRPWYKFTMVGMLLLGVGDIIRFTADKYAVYVTLGEAIRISVEPLSLLFIIVFYSLERAVITSFLKKYLLPSPSPQRLAAYRRESIDQFKETFSRKSNEALRLMLQERKVVPAALQAAQELLQERHAVNPEIQPEQ